MCLGPDSWAREGRASSAGGAPAPAPLAHANQPGSATGWPARWEPPTFPAGSPQSPPAARRPPSPTPGIPRSSLLCWGPFIPLHLHPSYQETLPSSRQEDPRPCGKGRATSGGVAGQGAERGLGRCPCSARTLVLPGASSLGLSFTGTVGQVALDGLQGPIWTWPCLPAGCWGWGGETTLPQCLASSAALQPGSLVACDSRSSSKSETF